MASRSEPERGNRWLISHTGSISRRRPSAEGSSQKPQSPLTIFSPGRLNGRAERRDITARRFKNKQGEKLGPKCVFGWEEPMFSRLACLLIAGACVYAADSTPDAR